MPVIAETSEFLRNRVAALLAYVVELWNALSAAQERQTVLEKELAAMQKQHEEDDAKIAALTEKVETLSAKKVKKDSHNSSVPPSKDGYSKPNPKTLREKSGKPQGGQKGHTGHGMEITREPDEVKQYLPHKCEGCPYFGKCNYHCSGTHYTCEIEIKSTVTAHQTMACTCPLNNESISGEFPEEARAPKQYGTKLQAFIGSLSTSGYVSVGRTAKLINGLGIPISTGTVQNIIDVLAQKVDPVVEQIKAKIASFDVLNCDETGMKVNGKLNWLHCICTPKWSYMAFHEKRGSEAMDEIGILPGLDNCTLIHDFWASYLNYIGVRHAFCNAHITRELVYAYESTGQKWADDLKQLLSKMCGRRNEIANASGTAFPEDELKGYLEKYDCLIREGMEANPIQGKAKGKRGRLKRGKTRCLVDRLHDYKDQILCFATDWSIPFTNNEAEKTIRFSKVKEKVSGGFRTKAGADGFAKLMSFVSTANKHGMFVYEALTELLNGRALSLVESWD